MIKFRTLFKGFLREDGGEHLDPTLFRTVIDHFVNACTRIGSTTFDLKKKHKMEKQNPSHPNWNIQDRKPSQMCGGYNKKDMLHHPKSGIPQVK